MSSIRRCRSKKAAISTAPASRTTASNYPVLPSKYPRRAAQAARRLLSRSYNLLFLLGFLFTLRWLRSPFAARTPAPRHLNRTFPGQLLELGRPRGDSLSSLG